VLAGMEDERLGLAEGIDDAMQSFTKKAVEVHQAGVEQDDEPQGLRAPAPDQVERRSPSTRCDDGAADVGPSPTPPRPLAASRPRIAFARRAASVHLDDLGRSATADVGRGRFSVREAPWCRPCAPGAVAVGRADRRSRRWRRAATVRRRGTAALPILGAALTACIRRTPRPLNRRRRSRRSAPTGARRRRRHVQAGFSAARRAALRGERRAHRASRQARP
jgi:hypothetical protein